MSSKWTRREFVKRTGVATGALVFGGSIAEFLAACTSGGTTGGKNELEIFSWWTAGGEADGLAEMFKIYKQKYSGVTIINAAVAGGAGSNAKAVLATRMQGGKPPDSFQVHAGQELISTWVKADKMEPITSIWNSEGWDSVMPKDLKTIVSKGSDVWSVPVNVHRGNAMWVNVAKAGSNLQAGSSNNLDNFLSALGKLKAGGVQAPLALGSKGNWQVTMLLENNIVAVGGPDFYRGLFSGQSSWSDKNIKTALTYIKSMLNYVNSDHATIDWDQASGRVQAGTSAAHDRGGRGLLHGQQLEAQHRLHRHPVAGDREDLHDRLRHLWTSQGRSRPRQRDQLDQGLRLPGRPGGVQPQEGLHPGAHRRVAEHLRPHRAGFHRRVQDRLADAEHRPWLGGAGSVRQRGQRRDGPVRAEEGRQRQRGQPGEARRPVPEVTSSWR